MEHVERAREQQEKEREPEKWSERVRGRKLEGEREQDSRPKTLNSLSSGRAAAEEKWGTI